MTRYGARKTLTAWAGVALSGVGGCTSLQSLQSPMQEGALIRKPEPPPLLPPPPEPNDLPDAPAENPPPAKSRPGTDPDSPLALHEVLSSVEAYFPLIYAIEQERAIAGGERLASEGAFDPVLRARGSDTSGTFSNGRLDVGVEQPLAANGATTYAGWRLGQGNFPVYYGDRKTGQGGELRSGISLPILQNRDIDPRRAKLRAAQIKEQLADPIIVRARLEYFRNAAQAYWAWQAAGAQYRVAARLVDLGVKRQEIVDIRQKAGLISASSQALNLRLVASRREAMYAAERNVQQAAIRLSLFLRDSNGDPVVPPSDWLIPNFLDIEPPPPDPEQLRADVEAAIARRPELVRFRLQKEIRTVELQLAANQILPTLNTFVGIAQDVGYSKKNTIEDGQFKTDRTNAEVGATFEVPLPRRDARGRVLAAQAQLSQLLAEERYTRDDITAQVQDAVSELTQTYERVAQFREEVRQAQRVVEIETTLFDNQQINLFELNLQEIAAAEAQVRAAAVIGQYFAAVASYLATIGLVPPIDGSGGAVLPKVTPIWPEDKKPEDKKPEDTETEDVPAGPKGPELLPPPKEVPPEAGKAG